MRSLHHLRIVGYNICAFARTSGIDWLFCWSKCTSISYILWHVCE